MSDPRKLPANTQNPFGVNVSASFPPQNGGYVFAFAYVPPVLPDSAQDSVQSSSKLEQNQFLNFKLPPASAPISTTYGQFNGWSKHTDYSNSPMSSAHGTSPKSQMSLSLSQSGGDSDFGDDSDEQELHYLQMANGSAHHKLPSSKSPIIDAMSYCAVHGYGVSIVRNTPETATQAAQVIFLVADFKQYYRVSQAVCSKQHPTDDLASRVKALRRWFVNFPKKRDRNDAAPFYLEVKPALAKKVNEMVDKHLGL